MAKWKLTILSVCMHIHYGCCRSLLQWLQNAGNRMLFFIAVILYSLESFFCVCISESIQNIYGWLLNMHTQNFLLIYCFANSTIQSVTDFDKLLLFWIFYCVEDHKALIWTNCVARGKWLGTVWCVMGCNIVLEMSFHGRSGDEL